MSFPGGSLGPALRRTKPPSRAERADAAAIARLAIAGNLQAAREHARLTPTQLARKLKVTAARVRGAEFGARVSATYVAQVLKACGLPAGWKAG